MEIPFDYILISIMINLKNRKVKAEVSKQSLIKIINKIIYNLNVNEKEKLEIINNFDFEYELDTFYNNHIEYFELTSDSIILDDNVSIEDLENILENNDIDELILNEIDSLLKSEKTFISGYIYHCKKMISYIENYYLLEQKKIICQRSKQ